MTGAAKLPLPVLIITARVAAKPNAHLSADNHVQNLVAVDVRRSDFFGVICGAETDRRQESGRGSSQTVMPENRDR